ncbi:MAG: hypothetical protein WA055_00390 [Candidatus Moraniibacteriota bacterium]
MKKIISRIFVKIVVVSLVILSFSKRSFAQLVDSGERTAGLPTQTLGSLIVEVSNWAIVILLFPLSFLLMIFFYAKYFLIRKKTDDISKIKTKKSLKKAKIFLIILILLILLYILQNFLTHLNLTPNTEL